MLRHLVEATGNHRMGITDKKGCTLEEAAFFIFGSDIPKSLLQSSGDAVYISMNIIA